nr:PREDICTED: calcium/calmodulin-dependent protein kinase type II subunit beta-like [Paralichthys olivaceus]
MAAPSKSSQKAKNVAIALLALWSIVSLIVIVVWATSPDLKSSAQCRAELQDIREKLEGAKVVWGKDRVALEEKVEKEREEQVRLTANNVLLLGRLNATNTSLEECRQENVSKLIVLDPQKRLSVREALQHPWVLGKAARFSHMDTTQRKLQEFNARRKLKAAMKAVVATSRMHEGSRRRTDSCEIPSSGASRQSSMQQDPPPDSTDPTPSDKEPPPSDQQPQDDESDPTDKSALSPLSPRVLKSPSSDVTPTDAAPTRPPLRADGLRQMSVSPKTVLVQPPLQQKSCSMVEPTSGVEATPVRATPPCPNSLTNGFTPGAEPANQMPHCQ